MADVPSGLPETRIVASPHASLGPKLTVYHIVADPTAGDADVTRSSDRSHVSIPPLPGGGR